MTSSSPGGGPERPAGESDRASTDGDRPRADYRYLLANERTFLAYVRTGLSLQVAGLGALQFLTAGQLVIRLVLGVGLVLTGSVVSVSARAQRSRNERAIRAGQDIASNRVGTVVVAVVAVVPLVAAVVIALS